MIRDKEWFKNQIEIMGSETSENYPHEQMVDREVVLRLIDQLEEPETLSQEWINIYKFYDEDLDAYFVHTRNLENLIVAENKKVIIPQFVADEFDYNKKPFWEVEESKDVSHILRCAFGDEAKPSDFLDWVRENVKDYVMAVRYGYEVEKEPLYYVLNKKGFLMMRKYEGEIDTMRISNTLSIDGIGDASNYLLTEKEIKDYDERYFQFAELVEEEVK